MYTYICYHSRWLVPFAFVSNIEGGRSSVCDSETIAPLPRTFWRSRSMAYSERSDLCSTRWGKLMRWNSVSLVCVYVCYLIFIYIYMSIHTHTRRARTCAWLDRKLMMRKERLPGLWCVCVCCLMYKYVYIYVYTHAHTRRAVTRAWLDGGIWCGGIAPPWCVSACYLMCWTHCVYAYLCSCVSAHVCV